MEKYSKQIQRKISEINIYADNHEDRIVAIECTKIILMKEMIGILERIDGDLQDIERTIGTHD